MKGYEVKVLKPGYATRVGPAQQRADGSITLIKGPTNIVVDTGGPWDRPFLLEKLREEGLQPGEIDFVICTHGHSDHVGNVNLFPEATVIVSHDVSKGDLYTSHDFARGPYRIDDDVDVVATPGHTAQDVSVVVRTTRGTYVVAGDLFECAEDLEHDELWRSLSEHPEEHARSRQKVLDLADFIVPGHGEMFGVPPRRAREGDR
jgi:glyoxylase-like metal-dependent hydrolase (beta-lactamase superfamily II)